MALTIAEIAAALGTTAHGDTSLIVRRPAEPKDAGPDDLALAMQPAFAAQLTASGARAAIVWADADWQALGLQAAITVPRARLAMAALTQAFDPAPRSTGIHPTAIVPDDCSIGADPSIGPFVVLAPGTVIGARVRLDAHVSIGPGSTLGDDCLLHAGVRIGRGCRLGDRVILQSNVVIGADGFSYVTRDLSHEERASQTLGRVPLTPPADATRHRIHSLGGVILGDDVEVGANSCIDAGTIRPTQVGRGTKIDDLVLVGHNCIIGADNILCGQVAMAGSGTLGDRVVMGGRAATNNRIIVGNDVVVAAAANVYGHVPDGQFIMGSPALDMPSHRVRDKALRRLPQMMRDIAALQKRVPNDDAKD
ncbi:UDP-3-O-[3-hydroxymyristoyl] glucosamine N-acyltransferase [Loktanella fryxellensis]|uniref:UDP-3-O-[3-hydroxymyristoyl] glucosamine N-acyltransferase n=1 Tax=Loktanella fryxellensis TaxID=245187 RepID=A0A1H8BDS3_9RHOB|nr:UDP-3-O-(3-hydroxymyristoyl)glucosamine N-acyltransferase [Loktanella fryxellensis]SEM80973.1 UDP-3-O-[3-hydroxymyristoyl] glucosamine N-acyltransferase [Loktanella fryxellensis]